MELSKVFHDSKSKNFGRAGVLFKDGDAEKNALSVNLMNGWWNTQPISVVEMNKDEIAAAVAARQAEWDALKTSELEHVFDLGDKKVTVVPAEMRLAFESVYTDGKGKIIPPKYSAVFGFRRGAALLGAIALRLKQKLGDFNEIPIATDANGKVTEKGLPVNVEHYKSEYERVAACAIENFGKSVGLSSVDSDWPTILKVTRELRDFHRQVKGTPLTEAECVRIIGSRGSGQKAFYLSQLDTKYPTLHVIDNIVSNKTPGGGLDRMALLKLRDDKNATEQTIAAYLADPKKAKKNAIKRMPDKTLETFEKETPSRVLKAILKAVRTGDNAIIFAFYSYAIKVDAAAKGFLDHVKEQEEMRDSIVASGESMPEIGAAVELPAEAEVIK